MDCFNNTCLSCDRECEGHYCSPSCKLADHERATINAAASRPSPFVGSPTNQRSRAWQPAKRQASYVLEPAYDFTKSKTKTSRPTVQTSHLVWNPSMQSQHRDTSPIERSLSPSSSRSSLSSSASTISSSHGAMSAHDNEQLQDYFSSFEKVRASRRRSTIAR